MADYLIRHALILDVESENDRKADILIQDGKIAKIAPEIPEKAGATVIEAEGKYASAGWIDAHVHAYVGEGSIGIDPDRYLKDGVTFVLEAGTAGPGNFEDYLKTSVYGKKIALKSYLNLAPMGAVKGYGELTDLSKVDLDACEEMIRRYPEEIIGVKLRIDPRVCSDAPKAMELISRLSRRTGRPLTVHASRCSQMTLEEILSFMKEGDVFAHTYANKLPGLLDESGNVKEAARKARKRGVRFDLSHGKSNFSSSVAKAAFEQGFLPDAISTDLHSGSLAVVESLPMTMSKTMACGLDLRTVIRKVTADAAEMLRLTDKAAVLKEGDRADITLFSLEEGAYTFTDADGVIFSGTRMIRPCGVILGQNAYGSFPEPIRDCTAGIY